LRKVPIGARLGPSARAGKQRRAPPRQAGRGGAWAGGSDGPTGLLPDRAGTGPGCACVRPASGRGPAGGVQGRSCRRRNAPGATAEAGFAGRYQGL